MTTAAYWFQLLSIPPQPLLSPASRTQTANTERPTSTIPVRARDWQCAVRVPCMCRACAVHVPCVCRACVVRVSCVCYCIVPVSGILVTVLHNTILHSICWLWSCVTQVNLAYIKQFNNREFNYIKHVTLNFLSKSLSKWNEFLNLKYIFGNSFHCCFVTNS